MSGLEEIKLESKRKALAEMQYGMLRLFHHHPMTDAERRRADTIFWKLERRAARLPKLKK